MIMRWRYIIRLYILVYLGKMKSLRDSLVLKAEAGKETTAQNRRCLCDIKGIEKQNMWVEVASFFTLSLNHNKTCQLPHYICKHRNLCQIPRLGRHLLHKLSTAKEIHIVPHVKHLMFSFINTNGQARITRHSRRIETNLKAKLPEWNIQNHFHDSKPNQEIEKNLKEF